LTEQWSRTLLIFLLLTQTVITASRIRKILWAMLLSQFVVACFSIALQGENAAEGERVYGATRGFLSGNFFGIAVAMTLPYLAGFAVNTRSLFKRLLLVATFLSSMVMVALTASRGGLLCVLLALALSWVMVLRGGAHARIIGVILALAMLAAVVAAPGVLLSRFSTLWEAEGFATAGGGTLGEAKSSQLQREHLLRRSIAYTFEKPLFGAGLGNFQVLSGNRTGQSGEWKGTHNTFTQVSSEAGIPAFILFVAAIVVTIRRLEHISHAPAEGAEAADLNMLARATRVSLLSFVLAGFFAHLAYDFYMFYIIAIGVAVQTAAQRLKEQPENGAPQPPAAGPDGGPLPPREKDLSKRPANGPLSRTGRDWNR
jgi:O-antigen ligase